VDDLGSETSGNFKRVLLGLMILSAEYDAYCIHHAVKGLGTDEDCLIEILASRSNKEIEAMKASYQLCELHLKQALYKFFVVVF